ncbi:MAG: hypothetical protein ACYCU3_19050 [Streptosporangiaceae bacterium]
MSAPARAETIVTVVHGVNHAPPDEQLISCASCTTNCITPVAEVPDRRFGIERAVMTTVHAYTSSQQLIDGPSRDFRRGRAGAANMLPASTGAALATTREEAAGDRYRGILGVADDPVVSADIIGDSRASVVDSAMTRVVDGTLVKVMSWYDNEWGFSCQMIREACTALGLPAPDLSQVRP